MPAERSPCPALEMEMLCCSMASWMLVLSWSFIWGCASIRTNASCLSEPSCACVNVCEEKRAGEVREGEGGGGGREREGRRWGGGRGGGGRGGRET